jgi:hypothetical protein
MAHDDWRIHIELEPESDRAEFVERLSGGLGDEAKELAKTLAGDRLAVSGDGDDLFVYASRKDQAEHALEVIDTELHRHGFAVSVSRVEHWLEREERWDDEPKDETWEEEEVEHGWAPWEVRVGCTSHREAVALAEQLESDGYRPLRRWRYLIVGTDTREDADALARRLHGDVEVGGDVVWEEAADAGVVSPFRIFG